MKSESWDDELFAAREALTTLTCLQNAPASDRLADQIREDLAGKASILEMMKDYMTDLRGTKDNDALPYRKLHRLFELGATPHRMEGHHYGVAVGLRTGDLSGVAAEQGNLVGCIWGTLVADVAPWVGKTFTVMDEQDRAKVVGAAVSENLPVYRGINHFNVIEHAPVNVGTDALLTFMWHLKDAPDIERSRYGHEKNGGQFASYRAPSIYETTPREVFRLNYRFLQLENYPPLNYLIDEVVEIADGLYLGQVLFATTQPLERYDPKAKDSVYKYQNFGYFILFKEAWNSEARRLFPHLEVTETSALRVVPPSKFLTLTLARPIDGDVDAEVLESIRGDLAGSETIMNLLKSYSDALGGDPDTEAPEFAKLHTLFNAGIGPATMDGFYRGARITFQSHGWMTALNLNTLNIAWHAVRFFSPWTGKRFDPIEAARLSELTGGHEKMAVPTFFGSNTVVFHTLWEKFVRWVMRLAGASINYATEEDGQRYEYDALSFFFIGKQAESIVPENKGKSVFQFNYRWKNLRTPPPDNFCVDEIVQIADGLYLGKLIYATELFLPWDPATDSSAYKYKLFGYFLLMDEEWHALRLRIGFDLDNV